MTSVYFNPTLDRSRQQPRDGHQSTESYSGYVEPDIDIPPKPATITGDVTVNGEVISEAEILAEAQNHPADTPGLALRLAARGLVVRQLLLQEAKRRGIDGEPEQDGTNRSETAEDSAIRLLIESQVQVPQATEAECRRFYQTNTDKVSSASIIEARHILLAVKPADKAARADTVEKARNLQARLAQALHEFAALAILHSDCPSAQQGGNLGQLTPGSTVPEFEKALAAIEPGSAPAIIESRFGVHVVVIDRRIAGKPVSFDAARERIAAWLEAAAWSKAVSQYISILAGLADIRGIELEGTEGVLVQ